MESDVYRGWAIVERAFCIACDTREENGKGARFCAQCQATLLLLQED